MYQRGVEFFYRAIEVVENILKTMVLFSVGYLAYDALEEEPELWGLVWALWGLIFAILALAITMMSTRFQTRFVSTGCSIFHAAWVITLVLHQGENFAFIANVPVPEGFELLGGPQFEFRNSNVARKLLWISSVLLCLLIEIDIVHITWQLWYIHCPPRGLDRQWGNLLEESRHLLLLFQAFSLNLTCLFLSYDPYQVQYFGFGMFIIFIYCFFILRNKDIRR
jgi:hypothetical protein